MKPTDNATIVALPKEAGIVGDDCYLVEMNDRLTRLRALLGEQEKRKGRSAKWHGLKRFAGMM